jgi:hypothetical protein
MTDFVRVSTRDYVRRETIDGQEQVVSYRGDLGAAQGIRYSRELGFWPWGGRGGSLATGTINIGNVDGQYDQMIFKDLRDQQVTVKLPTSSSDIIALTAIVDTVSAPDDLAVEVRLRDSLSLLDVPLQDRFYGDDADTGVRDRPLPILLGIARSIRPTVWKAEPDALTTEGPAMRLHDGALSGIANVLESGVELNPLASPPGYAFDPTIGYAGITLGTDPNGVVTMDASSAGDAVVPTSAADVIGGSMDFTTDVGQIGVDWTLGADLNHQIANVAGRPDSIIRSVNYSGLGRCLVMSANNNVSSLAVLWTKTRVLEAGKTYRWEVELVAPVAGNRGINWGIFVMGANDVLDLTSRIYPLGNGSKIFLRAAIDANNLAGVYSGTYTVPEGLPDRYVSIAARGGATVLVRGVKWQEVPDPPPETLDGISLYDYAVEIVRRAGLPASIIDQASVDEVDPNREVIGFYADSPITALAALRAPLDSFGADVYLSRDGKFKFAKLRNPANEIPAWTVDNSNIVKASSVRVQPDQAPGLTTSMLAGRQWYVYRENDFDDSLSDREIKESLKREGKFIRTAILPADASSTGETAATGTGSADTPTTWPRMYRHAIGADPLVSLLDEADAAAAEIQRIADIYSTLRKFVEVEIWLEPGEFIELDDVVLFRYPRYEFDEGQNMLVVGVTDEVRVSGRRRSAVLRLWG